MKSKKSDIAKEVDAATVGALFGGILGMLFSPKSGKQNRDDIVKETKTAIKKVQSASKKAK